MNALRFAFRALSRDWKSGELNVLLLAVIVAVAALTAVGFFTNRVSQAVTVQAAQVLAADLRRYLERQRRSRWLPGLARTIFAMKAIDRQRSMLSR